MRHRVKCRYCFTIFAVLLAIMSIFMPDVDATDDKQSIAAKQLSSQLQSKSDSDSPLSLPVPLQLVKRASFMPSRGKKESDEYNVNGNDNKYEDKKASGFLPMRGRKDNYPNSQYWMSGSDIESEDKRAGFMPMRGRKSADDGVYIPQGDVYQAELDAIKRAAFMPMRGRKEDAATNSKYNNRNLGEDEFVMPSYQSYNSQIGAPNWIEGGGGSAINHENEDKRAKAFYGARGKRAVSYDKSGHMNLESNYQHESDKHHHEENFFATRG